MSDPQWQESEESKKVRKIFSASTELIGDYLVGLAIIKFPFLGLPVIKQAFKLIVNNMISDVDERGEMLIKWYFIDSQSDAKKDEYKEAIKELKDTLASNPTKDQKDEALQKAKDRLGKLIRFPVK